MVHGLQRLRGWFGCPGIQGTEQIMAGTGMHPPRRNAYLVAITETLGGAAIAAGAATPAAATGLTATMVTATRKVHWPNGFFTSNGGWEFNAVLIAAVTAPPPMDRGGGPSTGRSGGGAGEPRWH